MIFEWDSDDCVAVPLIRYHDGLGAPAGSGREPTSLIRAEQTSQLDHLEEHFVGACGRYLLGEIACHERHKGFGRRRIR